MQLCPTLSEVSFVGDAAAQRQSRDGSGCLLAPLVLLLLPAVRIINLCGAMGTQ
jgi:hypothetical protein